MRWSVGQILLRLDQQSYLPAIVDAEAWSGSRRGRRRSGAAPIEQLPEDATPGQIESAQAELRLAQADRS